MRRVPIADAWGERESLTDEQMGEIYLLARDSLAGGRTAFQVQAYPFRLTPANLARHRTNPHVAFWQMLKIGNDHFEATSPRTQGGCVRSPLCIQYAASS